jgi:hypothetical protein
MIVTIWGNFQMSIYVP